MNSYIQVLKNYAQFSGRTSRADYWTFVAINLAVAFILGVVASHTRIHVLNPIYKLGVLVPSLAVAVRRLHDTGHRGWFLLIPFYNLYLLCSEAVPSESGTQVAPEESKSAPAVA